MTLWCIFKSPLMIGAEMRDNDNFTLKLLTNKRLLNMHKYGRKPEQVFRKDDIVVWKSRTKTGKLYAAFFNIGEKTKKTSFKYKDFGIRFKISVPAVDVWNGKSLRIIDKMPIELKPHTVRCYEIATSETLSQG